MSESESEASVVSESDDDMEMSDEDSFISDDDGDYKKKKKPAKKTPAKSTPKKTMGTPAKKNLTPIKSSTTSTPTSTLKISSSSASSSPSSSNNLNIDNTSKINLPEGVEGPGSHEHNFYEFLKPENRKDLAGRRMNHPDYNPRTLFVPSKYLDEQTPAMQQWWWFKARNMDTILFFKVGKFYELFHMDSDVGYQELDLIYMKGSKGHSGFPEISYGKFASILVDKGYKVARVEQTETPEMLKERNSTSGKKDKVVKREICSIMTKGTRTYNHLEDLTHLDNLSNDVVSSSSLMILREKVILRPKENSIDNSSILSSSSTLNINTLSHHFEIILEYGITLIDSTLGNVTLTHFKDNYHRSNLKILIKEYQPTEVILISHNNSSNSYNKKKLNNNITSKYLSKDQISSILKDTGSLIKLIQNNVEVEICQENFHDNCEIIIKQLKQSNYFHDFLVSSSNIIEENTENLNINKKKLDKIHSELNEIVNWPPVLFQLIKSYYYKNKVYEEDDENDTQDDDLEDSYDMLLFSFGAGLWSLKRAFLDYDVLTMGKFFSYLPKDVNLMKNSTISYNKNYFLQLILNLPKKYYNKYDTDDHFNSLESNENEDEVQKKDEIENEDEEKYDSKKRLILDEVTLTNLEILTNNYDHTQKGSLWNFINRTSTAFGRRLLYSWLCSPLYFPKDIKKRSDAIEELLTIYYEESERWRKTLSSVPDIERLLMRIHSNGLRKVSSTPSSDHPDTRAVMYENVIYTQRKLKDFVDAMNGLEKLLKISEESLNLNFSSQLLKAALHPSDYNSELAHENDTKFEFSKGKFPLYKVKEILAYFRSVFNEKQVKTDGFMKPYPGVNKEYDEANEEIQEIHAFFDNYIKKIRKETGIYEINYFGSGKDRYQLEIPINSITKISSQIKSWIPKSQKKTHRRFWTPEIEKNFLKLTNAEVKLDKAQKDTLRKIFSKFDENYQLFQQVITNLSLLDCLLALASVSSLPSYTWPEFVMIKNKNEKINDEGCYENGGSSVLIIKDGRHPMLEFLLAEKGESDFIPNDLTLGSDVNLSEDLSSRFLLLTGPNMGGKSTLLRQTCLIIILAQLGCKVPASSCKLTPVDRIFTRLGASDRILKGQSTFFVELLETALILKEATSSSLCILDELGRGTSTFDGTAIAHAVINHLVNKTRCRTLFATHYHLLVSDWNYDPRVKLGHMDCLVNQIEEDDNENDTEEMKRIKREGKEEVTFLYKLCDGSSPKSYGINVARLAGIPTKVLELAIQQSFKFEELQQKLQNGSKNMNKLASISHVSMITGIYEKIINMKEHLNSEELYYFIVEIWNRIKSTL